MSSGTVRDCPCDSCLVSKLLRRCLECREYRRAIDELEDAASKLKSAQKRELEGHHTENDLLAANKSLIEWAIQNDEKLFERIAGVQTEAATKIGGKAHNASVSSSVNVDGSVPKQFESIIAKLDSVSKNIAELTQKRHDAEDHFQDAVNYVNRIRRRFALTDKTPVDYEEGRLKCLAEAEKAFAASPTLTVLSLPAKNPKVLDIEQ